MNNDLLVKMDQPGRIWWTPAYQILKGYGLRIPAGKQHNRPLGGVSARVGDIGRNIESEHETPVISVPEAARQC